LDGESSGIANPSHSLDGIVGHLVEDATRLVIRIYSDSRAFDNHCPDFLLKTKLATGTWPLPAASSALSPPQGLVYLLHIVCM
jgi:hypothetical protein